MHGVSDKMKIYVASSWRNTIQPSVVEALREAGYEVYDFRNPPGEVKGFHWSEIDLNWKEWTHTQFAEALDHPLAESQYILDKTALDQCDAGVLVMPCGRSAHLEAGYLVGQGKPVFFLLSDAEPELMYKMGFVTDDLNIILELLALGVLPL